MSNFTKPLLAVEPEIVGNRAVNCGEARCGDDRLIPPRAQDPAELSYRPGVASLHRPDPMTIVVTPSLVVALAYVKLPP